MKIYVREGIMSNSCTLGQICRESICYCWTAHCRADDTIAAYWPMMLPAIKNITLCRWLHGDWQHYGYCGTDMHYAWLPTELTKSKKWKRKDQEKGQ